MGDGKNPSPVSPVRPWPEGVAGTPAAIVIEQALGRDRLSHSLLLHGDDFDILSSTACAIADRLLNPPGTRAPVPAERNGDCLAVRPTGKSRQITVEAVRSLIARVQLSSGGGGRKVAILHEAERMNGPAANILLKTLEEPPAHTTLILLTTHPYALLPTIRSRVLHFRFPGALAAVSAAGWPAWIADYQAWMGRVAGGIAGRRRVADEIMAVYGLLTRFGMILEQASDEELARRKESLQPGLEEDEWVAMEAGLAHGIRTRLFVEIENATRVFAAARLKEGDLPAARAFTGVVDRLEHVTGLLRVNFNENAALEDFLLMSLRSWAGVGAGRK